MMPSRGRMRLPVQEKRPGAGPADRGVQSTGRSRAERNKVSDADETIFNDAGNSSVATAELVPVVSQPLECLGNAENRRKQNVLEKG